MFSKSLIFNPSTFCFRLRFLVFDDIHVLFESHYAEVMDLINQVNHYIQKQGTASNIQTVFCGQEWNDKVACAAVKTSEDPLLFVCAPMQAIRYGGVDVQVYFLHPDDKLKVLSGN